MVYQIQVKTIQYLKSLMPNLKIVEYFSDGCAAQYKNRKSFFNLCKHQEDFGVEAAWSFFAMSHGKSPCDGIGGTIKRTTALESLPRPLENQILDVDSMMSYCKSAIPKIQFVKVLKDDLNHVKAVLEPRFQKSSRIKGTRTFHFFKPLSATRLRMKRISQDNKFSPQVNLEDENRFSLIQNAHENQFLVAAYDKNGMSEL